MNYLIKLNANHAHVVDSGIALKKGDKGITFNIEVEGIDISGATKMRVCFRRANNTSLEDESLTPATTVNYTLKGNELVVVGKVVVDVKYYFGDTGRVSSASFSLDCLVDTLNGFQGSTDNYSEPLDRAIKEAQSSAERAKAEADRAFSGTPEGYSEVVDKVNSFSNPNLLDNPFFTVNQRQGKITTSADVHFYGDADLTVDIGSINYIVSSVTHQLHSVSNKAYIFTPDNGGVWFYVKASDVVDGYVGNVAYTVDRWVINNDGAIPGIQITNGGVRLLNTNDYIEQYNIDNIANLNGKTLTFSMITDSGVSQFTFVHGTENYTILKDGFTFYHTIWAGKAYYRVITYDTTKTIYATKLELGTVSTLANDIAPNYATELMKCQRYYVAFVNNSNLSYIFNGINYENGLSAFCIPLNSPLRTTPTIQIKNLGRLKISDQPYVDVVNNPLIDFVGNSMIRIAMYSGVSEEAPTVWDGCQFALSADL